MLRGPWQVLFALAILWPRAADAAGQTFGGFDADEGTWLALGGPGPLACAPLAAHAAADNNVSLPRCHAIDHQVALGYKKPARTRKLDDGTSLVVTAVDGTLRLTALGAGGVENVLVSWSGRKVASVNANLFVSPGGGLIGVEYAAAGGEAGVVVFDLHTTTLPAAPVGQPASRPATASGPAANATDRAIGHGGKWEQRMVPCDEAGVYLELKTNHKVDIKIETRCQGDKNVTHLTGGWVGEGDDQLVLTFDNEGGESESMTCRFATCSDVAEDCLTCAQEDVSFTLKTVRR